MRAACPYRLAVILWLAGGMLSGCALTGSPSASSASASSASAPASSAPAGSGSSSAAVARSAVDRAAAAAGARPEPPAGKLAQAQRTHEYPSPAQPQRAASGASNPVVVIEVFATAYINWNATTVAPTMRALEQVSVGQARSEMAVAAAQTAQDYELRRGGIANAGVVEAIAPLIGHPDEYAVVTREQTTAANTNAYQGLRPAWHLALATVVRLRPGQWVLSSWQPEN